jgi:hypothetical protein
MWSFINKLTGSSQQDYQDIASARPSTVSDSDSSSDSEDDSKVALKQYLKAALKVAETAYYKFDFYPWKDTPGDIKNDDIANQRINLLEGTRGYPLREKINEFSEEKHAAFDLLFIFYHVKNKKPFNKGNFYNNKGVIRDLHDKLGGQ